MAPKKALPPPSPEPEEEEETSEEESGESEEGEGEESEVEEKEEHKGNTTQIPPPQVKKKASDQKQTTPLSAAPQSEEEEEEEEEGEEEGEESDSPPSPNVSDFTIKPISPAKPALKDAKPTSKRTLDVQKADEKDSRNKKKVKTHEGEEKKEKGEEKKEKASAVSTSGGVGKVWSEEDEIAVLQGMIDYQSRNGADPSNDMGAFHEFIKGKLQADISKTQLYEKVRRFKKKFFTNVEKAQSGEDPVFSKPHEYKAFDLSKKIWGSGAYGNGGGLDNVNTKSNNGKVKKGGKIGSMSGIVEEGEIKGVAKVGSISGSVKEGEKDDVGDDAGNFQSKYPYLCQSFDLDCWSFLPDGVRSSLKENLGLIDGAKARELEGKWEKLREQEAQFFLERMTLITEQTKLVLDVWKKGN